MARIVSGLGVPSSLNALAQLLGAYPIREAYHIRESVVVQQHGHRHRPAIRLVTPSCRLRRTILPVVNNANP